MDDPAGAAALVKQFAEYGGVAAVLALAWWRAEKRAETAQKTSDDRAMKIVELSTSQVASNNAVTAALHALTVELNRR